MRLKNYRIAGLDLEINYDEGILLESLLPSFSPFEIDSVSDVVLRVDVHRGECASKACRSIGVFDSGSASYDVGLDENNNYIFNVIPAGADFCVSTLVASPDFSWGEVVLPHGMEEYARFGLNNALMVAYAFSSAFRGALLMHSSVVVNGGRGYLFLGVSGMGKSTHSSLWIKNIEGTRLLNDDNPVLRIVDGRVMVYGSPWSGKTPCYLNRHVEMGAIVKIKQAPYNKLSVFDTLNSFAVMTSSCSRIKWDRAVSNAIYETITKVVAVRSLFQMECLPDDDAAKVCYNGIKEFEYVEA